MTNQTEVHENVTGAPVAITPNYVAIKKKQNAAWASGDYAIVGTTLQIVGETLAEEMNLAPNCQVLDVAAGNGNATLAFARRWNRVTSTDYVPTLLEKARVRAEAEGLEVRFQTADAEALPYRDHEFDAVVSTFGVMFAPNQQMAANELVRVCRSGGNIGLANWTPDGFIGHLFKTLGKHVSLPAGVLSPALWGDNVWIENTFGEAASNIDVNVKDFVFRYRSPAHFMEVFQTFYGPVHKVFLALDPVGRKALEADLYTTIAKFNTASDGSMRAPSQYVEVILTKK